ncbi:hypothetical protein J2741_002288 [Methanolinea mesophila]|uniref:hypothetical protein n=1 Tax=Methanolinea mesophila TaxID=547055 RepID=UPI001AE54458|nr:hypothetical protein [Methanolinea mesophila]MBP1929741.1 hypothetical protein [Methanolinea mesophila]
MPDSSVSIVIPRSIASLLEEEANRRGIADITTLACGILSSHFARGGELSLWEKCDQQEYLKLRIESLLAALKRKDQEISALLELWHVRLGKEGETLAPDEKKMMEKKISEIQHDWYLDVERRDFSGADTNDEIPSSGEDPATATDIPAGREL